ncbi:Protein trachealess [Halotydeus destructor]|nr:Protein trachealess [Halotydeus destructor]
MHEAHQAAALMDPSQHYNPYAHPYYRVGGGVKDHHHHQSVETAAQAAAVQTRILEMRKEKSRDAARSRRGKENHEFYELAKMLPLPAAITSQLDKASIIRLTISYLKLRDFSTLGEPSWCNNSLNNNSLKSSKLCKQNNVFDVHQGTHILQSLDGFAFALGSDGRFLYISETVSIYLGLSQVELTGSSIFDYVHQQDHSELAEVLGISIHTPGSGSGSAGLASPLPPASVGSTGSSESESTPYASATSLMSVSGPLDTLERQFCIRMKSTLTKRGCQHFKSSGYRVVNVVGHLRVEANQQNQSRRDSGGSTPKVIGLVGLAIALPPPSVNELRLESDHFVVRLGLDLKIMHCEPRVTELLDYSSEELVGRNMYSLVHGQDALQLRKWHTDLIHKGQVMSKYYRLMNKNGGFTWVQSCATLICSSPSSSSASAASKSAANSANGTSSSSTASQADDQEQCIIMINYVISGMEVEDVIMDANQLPGACPLLNDSTGPKRQLSQSKQNNGSSPCPTPPSRVRPEPASSVQSQHSSESPDSPQTGGGPDSKRRRFTSSPVRPWKSPSPHNSNPSTPGHDHSQSGSPQVTPSASNLLRHISVIRETPPVLKPQVVTPPYHAHHHHAAHHYHHLVDPYAAAYHHLYKNGAPGGGMSAPATPSATASATGHHHSHHWGAYN